jgi:hypothetical protein
MQLSGCKIPFRGYYLQDHQSSVLHGIMTCCTVDCGVRGGISAKQGNETLDRHIPQSESGAGNVRYRGANKFRCSICAWHSLDLDFIPDFLTYSAVLPQPNSIHSPGFQIGSVQAT